MNVTMRQPCKTCGALEGESTPRNGQDIVRCSTCDTYAYCRPKAESGEPQRSVTTRPGIKPKQRYRILEAFGHACASCNAGDVPLHIGHLISVDSYHRFGEQIGMTEDEVWADENLVALCEECNLGMGNTVASVRLILRSQRMRRAVAGG